jgi:hypothetical protein
VIKDELILIASPLNDHVADVSCCVCVVCYESGRAKSSARRRRKTRELMYCCESVLRTRCVDKSG